MFKGISYAILLLFPFASFAYGTSFYVGTFGGGGYSNYGILNQRSIVYVSQAQGGPLFVNATGNANNKPAWFAGIHAGRQWEGWSFCTFGQSWCLVPAGELEGYYLNSRISAQLKNLNSNFQEHLFVDTFKVDTGVLLVNSVWIFNMPRLLIQPYAGIGIGTAIVSLYSANSTQINPAEPGINHFNSGPNDFNWTFAVQAKTGIRFNITRNVRLFAEYRYLYLNPTNYQFGSTQYPSHLATNNWNVHLGCTGYHLGSVGIEYSCDAIC